VECQAENDRNDERAQRCSGVRNNPDSGLRPASQRVLNGSSALEVKACSGPVSVLAMDRSFRTSSSPIGA